MKLRGELRFELELLLHKRSKSLKGTRDNKIQKKRRTSKLMPLLLQIITETVQVLVIAFCAAMVVDYLKDSQIGSFWMIMGIIIIALILVKAFKLESN